MSRPRGTSALQGGEEVSLLSDSTKSAVVRNKKTSEEIAERLEYIKSLLSNKVYSLSKLIELTKLTHSQVFYAVSLLEKTGDISCVLVGKVKLCSANKDAIDKTLNSIIDAVIETVTGRNCKSKCCSVPTSLIINGVVNRSVEYVKLTKMLTEIGVPITVIHVASFLFNLFLMYKRDALVVLSRKKIKKTRIRVCNGVQ